MKKTRILSLAEREHVVAEYRGGKDAETVAKECGISIRTVYRLSSLKWKTGSLALETDRCGRKPKLTPAQLEQVRRALTEEKQVSLAGLIERFQLPCKIRALYYIVEKKLGFVNAGRGVFRKPGAFDGEAFEEAV